MELLDLVESLLAKHPRAFPSKFITILRITHLQVKVSHLIEKQFLLLSQRQNSIFRQFDETVCPWEHLTVVIARISLSAPFPAQDVPETGTSQTSRQQTSSQPHPNRAQHFVTDHMLPEATLPDEREGMYRPRLQNGVA